MMKRRLYSDFALCAFAGLFYLANRLWLSHFIAGWPSWFLRCYANDIAAGLVLCAWTDLMLHMGRRPPLTNWVRVVLLLLICGLVWEVFAPLWKPGAVFDPWDFVAYQAGGLLWLLKNRISSA